MFQENYEIQIDRTLFDLVSKIRNINVVNREEIYLPTQILLIEDDKDFAEITASAIEESSDSEVTIATSPADAYAIIAQSPFDLIVTDWNLPATNAFNNLEEVNQRIDNDAYHSESWSERQTPVIVCTVSDKSIVEFEQKPGGHFRYVGYVSKQQPMGAILREFSEIYNSNSLLH